MARFGDGQPRPQGRALWRAIPLACLALAAACASAPPRSLLETAVSPHRMAGARCDTLLVSRELQIPPEGKLADLRLSISSIPETLGPLRILVRRPRYAGALEMESLTHPQFDEVYELEPHRELTVVLPRPKNADRDWPREECKACRVEVELSGLFGMRAALDAFFTLALQQADAIEAAFAAQSKEPEHAGRELRDAAEKIEAQTARCGVHGAEGLVAVAAVIEALDRARAKLYASDDPDLPDGKALEHAWDAAVTALDALPWAAESARAAGFPISISLKGAQPRMHHTAEHLALSIQPAMLGDSDRKIVARWIAIALAPDAAALAQQIRRLPPIRDLAEATARLAWIDPPGKVPVPGVTAAFSLRVKEWHAKLAGRRCFGPGGAGPLADPEMGVAALAHLLGADEQGVFHPLGAADLEVARKALARSSALLCEPPLVDASDLFSDLDGSALGPIDRRLRDLFPLPRREGIPDALDEQLDFAAAQPLCKAFAPASIARRIHSVADYKSFVDGGTAVLAHLPGPGVLVCDGQPLPASEVRRRLRDAYKAALEHHAVAEKLCPKQRGRCPEATADSVRKIFSLAEPALASPAPESSRALDFPPPFGFSAQWIQSIDRCKSEQCDALSRLRAAVPDSQFDGAVCSSVSGKRLLEVQLGRPDAPAPLRLTMCGDSSTSWVIIKLAAGSAQLVAVASARAFRFADKRVDRQGRHPQLGQVFERVIELSDRKDAQPRGDGAFEISLAPTADDQVFYFFPLRKREP